MMKKQFVAPRVIQVASVELERDLLLGSAFSKTVTVEATGQEVEYQSFDNSSTSTFNHTWE